MQSETPAARSIRLFWLDAMEDEGRHELCATLNKVDENTGQDEIDSSKAKMGEWIADYLEDTMGTPQRFHPV